MAAPIVTALPRLAIAAAVIAAVVTEGVRRRAGRRLLDIPNDRSSHHHPTPRGGSLGVVAGVIGVWAVWLSGGDAGGTVAPWVVLGGALLIAAVSWIDDLRGLRFSLRLLVHLVIAIAVVWLVGPFRGAGAPVIGFWTFGWASWPLTICWIVGLTNAYNFMDGIDGIAGGQGVVAGLAWWGVGSVAGVPVVATLGLLIAVTCGVFLSFNWSPARIFMGDVGSAPLGFLFAALPLLALHDAPASSAWVVVFGVAVVWPFVFDASFTFLRRWGRGEDVFAAHRSHLYQRMVIAGWSHRRVSLLYIIAAVVTSGAGIAVSTGLPGSGALAVGVAAGTGLGLWGLTVRLERRARPG